MLLAEGFDVDAGDPPKSGAAETDDDELAANLRRVLDRAAEELTKSEATSATKYKSKTTGGKGTLVTEGQSITKSDRGSTNQRWATTLLQTVRALETKRAAVRETEWQTRRVELMRRNVDNDKAYWRDVWRKRAKVPRTTDDLAAELEEHVASINSDLIELDELMYDPATRSSAKATLFQSKLRARELIAKARGFEKPEQPEDPSAAARPKLVVYDLSNCDEETKALYGVGGGGGGTTKRRS